MVDEPKKPEEKPDLKALQLLGVVAALHTPLPSRRDQIPDGYECLVCHERVAHTATCTQPRGFKRIS